MSELTERLERLRLFQLSDPFDSARVAPAQLAGTAATLFVLAAVVTGAMGAFLHPPAQQWTVPSQPSPKAMLASAESQAGFTAHTLAGRHLEGAQYAGATYPQNPVPGSSGIVLMYFVNAEQVSVGEYVDPAPSSPVTPATQFPPPTTAAVIAGQNCLVWTTLNLTMVTQVEFKTSDGLVIYLSTEPRGLGGGAIASVVGALASPSPATK